MAQLPKQILQGLSQVFPNALFYKPTQLKVVALTIDDVPTPSDVQGESTKLILDAIAAHNQQFHINRAAATFFIISSHLRGNTAILDAILNDGHEIGNHGVIDTTHAYLSPTRFESQLREAHQRLVTPRQPRIRWYRPGRGLYRPSMMRALTRLGELEGYEMKMALASVLPLDTFQSFSNPAFTARYVSQFIFPGAILVLHGGSRRQSLNTAQVLKILLPQLTQAGYRILTLSQLWDLRD